MRFFPLDISLLQANLTKEVYDKKDDFSFSIVNFPFFMATFIWSPSYGVYISQPFRYARECSNVCDLNEHNRCVTEIVLHQGFKSDKLLKTFLSFIIDALVCCRAEL